MPRRNRAVMIGASTLFAIASFAVASSFSASASSQLAPGVLDEPDTKPDPPALEAIPRPPDRPEGPLHGPSLPSAFAPHVIQDCDVRGGYRVTGFSTPPLPDLPTLTSVNIYQSHPDHGGGSHPMGYATVVVDGPGPQLVALSSYEPVTWRFEVGADTQLLGVFVLGYHEQQVQVDPSVPVTSLGSSPSCGYAYPAKPRGCRTDALIAAVEQAAGQPIQHFEGCYDASRFHIR